MTTTIHFETFDENSLLGLSAYLSQQYELFTEMQKARKLAAKLRPQVDQLRAIMNAVADITDCRVISEPDTAALAADVAYGNADLGTRVTITGGDVWEMVDRAEADYQQFDEGLPF